MPDPRKKRRLSVWWIASLIYCGTLLALTGAELYLAAHQRGHPGKPRWALVIIAPLALTALIAMLVRWRRDQPTPEESAAFWALFHASPGAVGAIITHVEGKPVVVTIVRSVTEYAKLLEEGQLPKDHKLYLAEDLSRLLGPPKK